MFNKTLSNTSFGDVRVSFYKNGFFYVEQASNDVINVKRLSFFKKRVKKFNDFKMALSFFDNSEGFIGLRNDFRIDFSSITHSAINYEVIFAVPKNHSNYSFNFFKAKKMIHEPDKIKNLIRLINIGLTNPSNKYLINVLNKKVSVDGVPTINAGFSELKSFFSDDEVLVDKNFINDLSIGKVSECDDFYLDVNYPLKIVKEKDGVYYHVANNLLSVKNGSLMKFMVVKVLMIDDSSQRRGGKRDFLVISTLNNLSKIEQLKEPLKRMIIDFNESALLNFTIAPVLFFDDERSNSYDLSLLLPKSIKDAFLRTYYSFIGRHSSKGEGLLYKAFSKLSVDVAVKSRLVFIKNFKQLVTKALMRGGDFGKIIINSFFKAVIIELNTLKKLLLRVNTSITYPDIKAPEGLIAYSVINGLATVYEPDKIIKVVNDLGKTFSEFLND